MVATAETSETLGAPAEPEVASAETSEISDGYCKSPQEELDGRNVDTPGWS